MPKKPPQKKTTKKSPKVAQTKAVKAKVAKTKVVKTNPLSWLAIMLVCAVGLAWQASKLTAPPLVYASSRPLPQSAKQLRTQFNALLGSVGQLENQEATKHINVVDPTIVKNEISTFSVDFSQADWDYAQADYLKLTQDLKAWQTKLTSAISAQALAAATPAAPPVPIGVFAPILLYHDTPPDFEAQLQYLRAHNYTAITMDQLVAGLLHQGSLPAKPVVITFDDGYSNQMTAFNLLEKYQMKATFYIIIIRADSGCDAENPSCNPDYLSWDQVIQLDQSGLITIGDHTVDHPDLATLSAADQQTEISSAKATLEAKLGHTIDQFAYPYGSYNDDTLRLVQADGFRAAVSTLPSNYQSKDYLYALRRVRSAFLLP